MQNYRRAAGFSGMMGQVSNKQSSETPADALADPTSTTSKPTSQSASKLPASDLSASEADYLQHLQLEASRTFEELEGEDRIDRSEVIADGVKEFAWWCLRLLVIAVTAYAAWFLLSKFSRGILPLALAILICSVLWPITRTLRNIGVPAGLASFATILAAFGFFGGLIALIAPSIGQQSQTLYYQAFEGVQKVQLWLQGPPLNVRDDDINKWFTDATIWLQRQSGTIAGELFAGIGVASTVMVTLGIVIVLTFFFLKDGDRFLPWTSRGLAPHRTTHTVLEYSRRLHQGASYCVACRRRVHRHGPRIPRGSHGSGVGNPYLHCGFHPHRGGICRRGAGSADCFCFTGLH